MAMMMELLVRVCLKRKNKMDEKGLLEIAKEFHSRENKLTLERYRENQKEWNMTVTKRIKGELTDEEALKIHKSLMAETDEAMIVLDNKEDFRKFSSLLASFDRLPEEIMIKQVEHEMEHSIPYKKAGIASSFGWFNFTVPTGNPSIKGKHFKPFHKPFGEKYNSLSSFEKDKLHYKSLKAVSSLSERDEEAIRELEERHGDKIKQ